MLDPVSIFIASYLSVVSSNVHEKISDIYGTELKTEFVQYENMNISFQHQMWNIKNKTICTSYNQGDPNYSKCTIKAKAFFTDMCKELTKRNHSNWKMKKLKKMYCNASINYQPFVASISNPKVTTEERDREKKCNLLILKTMGNKNKDLIAEKKLACK